MYPSYDEYVHFSTFADKKAIIFIKIEQVFCTQQMDTFFLNLGIFFNLHCRLEEAEMYPTHQNVSVQNAVIFKNIEP